MLNGKFFIRKKALINNFGVAEKERDKSQSPTV